jgi:hypothetical protein
VTDYSLVSLLKLKVFSNEYGDHGAIHSSALVVAVSGEVYAQSAVVVLMLVWKKKRFGRAWKRGVCGGSIN